MKSLYYSIALFLVFLAACKREHSTSIQPDPIEDQNWYILTAPDAREIKGVYGDIDDRLVITDGRKIYFTTDKGRSWQNGDYNANIGLFGFSALGDTLLVLNTLSTTSASPGDLFATRPSHYSLDMGSTWRPYASTREEIMVPMNRVKSFSGVEYAIKQQTSGGYIETTGISTSTGKTITLPARHQIKSLFLDQKSRLYVAGSAAICGDNKTFAFCASENGTLYVSKKTQP
jgi:hypothetical protein